MNDAGPPPDPDAGAQGTPPPEPDAPAPKPTAGAQPSPPSEPRLTSFLKSGTGMLTAAATLLAAIAGLVTAMTQFRGDDGGPATEAVTTVVAGDTAAERELRSHIPAAIRPTCGAPRYPEENAVAAFNCSYREIVGLQYNLFASDADLGRAVASVQKRYGKSTGKCSSEALLCFVRDGVASIIWADKSADVLSFAWRDDGNQDALYESWRKAIAP
jgi:hypothetical protein